MQGIKEADPLLAHAVRPYSALRDPTANEVRIFLDADAWLADELDGVVFATHNTADLEVTCKKFRLSDNQRQQSGYSLTCPDPGEAYTHVVLRPPASMYWPHDNLHALAIETIKTELVAAVGWCTAPLYSELPTFGSWVDDAVRVGVSRIYAYVAVSHGQSRHFSMVFGVRFIKANFTPFEPFEHPAVQYLEYQPHGHRFYFAQTTMLSECVYRNKHAHTYLVMADADEFLSIREPSRGLHAILQSAFLTPAAGVLLDVIAYPQACQPLWNATSQQMNVPADSSEAEACHLFDQTTMGYEWPKTIIMPARTDHFMVHNVHVPKPGFKMHAVYPSGKMHFKHIRVGAECTQGQSDLLIDDRNSTAFDEAAERNKKDVWFVRPL